MANYKQWPKRHPLLLLNAALFSCVKVSSVYVLATHGAGYSDANDILFIRRIVRATAGLAQICQWSESVAPKAECRPRRGVRRRKSPTDVFRIRHVQKQTNHF